MPEIHLLDQATINQIAAGEVIERPSSVVKELFENAADAKATAVTVEIRDGGISFIRVTDNGCGIEKDQVSLAFKRHATSKIKNSLDLVGVTSLGFRGEALSSIAAVSSVELISKTPESILGYSFRIEDGEEKGLEEIGAPDGTTFLVKELFGHVPARRKFLKTAATEGSYVSQLMENLALSKPDISVRFILNGQTKLCTAGNGKIKDLIYTVYGKEIARNLIEVSAENEFFSVKGYIGKPIISRGNRSFENYFINGRFIKSTLLSRAIETGYKSFMMQHRYPFTVLYFTVDVDLVDVNVHPAKMELRFRKEEEIYQNLTGVIEAALSGKEFIPDVSLSEEKKKETAVVKAPEPFEKARLQARQNILPPPGTDSRPEYLKNGSLHENQSSYGKEKSDQKGEKDQSPFGKEKADREDEKDQSPFGKEKADREEEKDQSLYGKEKSDREEEKDQSPFGKEKADREEEKGSSLYGKEKSDLQEERKNTVGTLPKSERTASDSFQEGGTSGIHKRIGSESGGGLAASLTEDLIFQTVKEYREAHAHSETDGLSDENKDRPGKEPQKENESQKESGETLQEENENRERNGFCLGEEQYPSEKAVQMSFLQAAGEDFAKEGPEKKHRLIGQLFDTYWLIEYDDKLYIMDQHAAHEKVLYERFMAAHEKKERLSQLVSPAVVVSLGPEEEQVLNRFLPELSEMGYEIEPFGGKEYALTAVPADIYSLDAKELFLDLLENLSAGNKGDICEMIAHRLATMSCKAAIKGGQMISFQEADALIGQLLTLKNPYNCPHGRPVLISMSRYELEKKFKRIV